MPGLLVLPTRPGPLRPFQALQAALPRGDKVVESVLPTADEGEPGYGRVVVRRGGATIDLAIVTHDLPPGVLDQLPSAARACVEARIGEGWPLFMVDLDRARGRVRFARDVASASATLYGGVFYDAAGVLGVKHGRWTAAEAAAAPMRASPQGRDREREFLGLVVLPGRAEPLVWGDMTRRLHDVVHVRPMVDGDDTRADAPLGGRGRVEAPGARVAVELVRPPARIDRLAGLVVDDATLREVHRLAGRGAHPIRVWFEADQPADTALALVVGAALAEACDGRLVTALDFRPPRLSPWPTVPEAAREAALVIDPLVPIGVRSPPEVRWSDQGGIDFGASREPSATPWWQATTSTPGRKGDRTLDHAARMRVTPLSGRGATWGEVVARLPRGVGVVAFGAGGRPSPVDLDGPIVGPVMAVSGTTALFVEVPDVREDPEPWLDLAGLDGSLRTRAEAALRAGAPTVRVHALAWVAEEVALATGVALAVAEAVGGVISADDAGVLARAGVAHTVGEVRAAAEA